MTNTPPAGCQRGEPFEVKRSDSKTFQEQGVGCQKPRKPGKLMLG